MAEGFEPVDVCPKCGGEVELSTDLFTQSMVVQCEDCGWEGYPFGYPTTENIKSPVDIGSDPEEDMTSTGLTASVYNDIEKSQIVTERFNLFDEETPYWGSERTEHKTSEEALGGNDALEDEDVFPEGKGLSDQVSRTVTRTGPVVKKSYFILIAEGDIKTPSWEADLQNFKEYVDGAGLVWEDLDQLEAEDIKSILNEWLMYRFGFPLTDRNIRMLCHYLPMNAEEKVRSSLILDDTNTQHGIEGPDLERQAIRKKRADYTPGDWVTITSPIQVEKLLRGQPTGEMKVLERGRYLILDAPPGEVHMIYSQNGISYRSDSRTLETSSTPIQRTPQKRWDREHGLGEYAQPQSASQQAPPQNIPAPAPYVASRSFDSLSDKERALIIIKGGYSRDVLEHMSDDVIGSLLHLHSKKRVTSRKTAGLKSCVNKAIEYMDPSSLTSKIALCLQESEDGLVVSTKEGSTRLIDRRWIVNV